MGKPKAEVAAERVMERVAGVTVTPHFCRIEDKPLDFYEHFHVIILGLDSLEARRFMNQVACSFLGAGLSGLPHGVSASIIAYPGEAHRNVDNACQHGQNASHQEVQVQVSLTLYSRSRSSAPHFLSSTSTT